MHEVDIDRTSILYPPCKSLWAFHGRELSDFSFLQASAQAGKIPCYLIPLPYNPISLPYIFNNQPSNHACALSEQKLIKYVHVWKDSMCMGLLLPIACFRGWIAGEVDFLLESLVSNNDIADFVTLYTWHLTLQVLAIGAKLVYTVPPTFARMRASIISPPLAEILATPLC